MSLAELFDAHSADPTGTAGIRRAWRAAGKLRMRLARAGIRQAVMQYDAMGVDINSPLAVHGAEVRLEAFKHWVNNAIERQLCTDWAVPFVRHAWAKGLVDAGGGTAAAAAVETLLSHELAGVSAAVAQAVSRIGFRHHQSKAKAWQMVSAVYDKEMAKRLPALIDSLTITAYNRGKLSVYRERGVQHVGIIPEAMPRSHVNRLKDAWQQNEEGEWHFVRSKRAKGRLEAEFEGELVGTQTAGDDKVCIDCQDIADDAPYELDEAMDLLPAHIGCRCAIVEWTGSEADDYLPSFIIHAVQDYDPDEPRDPYGKWAVGSGGLGHAREEEPEKKDWAKNVRKALHRQIELALTIGGGAVGASLGGVIGGMLGSAVGAISATQVNKLLTILERRDYTHEQAVRAVAKELGIKLKDYLSDAEIEDRYQATRQVLLDAVQLLGDAEPEHEFIQDPTTGKFAGSKPGAKGWQPSKSPAHAIQRINKLVHTKAGHSHGYRWGVNKHLDEVHELKLGDANNEPYKGALQRKIGESFVRQAKVLQDKGDTSKTAALVSKGLKYGFSMDEANKILGIGQKPPEWVPTTTKQQEEIFQKLKTSGGAKPAEPAEPAEPESGDPLAGWAKVGPQLGSNPGGTYADPNGDLHYVKFQKSEKHLNNEMLAARMYQLAGVTVPVQEALTTPDDAAEGTNISASRIVKGSVLNLLTDQERAAIIPKIQEGFAVDAWLANRDVIGLEDDNIIRQDSGQPVRIDQGGALLYRAQGEEKPFGPTVGEFDSLRDPAINKQSAAVFGSMTKQQLIDSIAKVTAISDDTIRGTAKAWDMEDVGEILIARKDDLAKRGDALYNEMMGKPAEPKAKTTYSQNLEAGEKIIKEYMAGKTPVHQMGSNEISTHVLQLQAMKLGVEQQAAINSKYGTVYNAMLQLAPAPELEKIDIPKPSVTSLSSAEAMVSEYMASKVVTPTPSSVASVLTISQKEALIAKHGSIANAMSNLLKPAEAAPALVTAPPSAKPFDPESKEAKLAAKGTPIPTGNLQSAEAKEAVAAFNKMYEGKTLTDPGELQGKIAYYSALMKEVQTAEKLHQAKLAEKNKQYEAEYAEKKKQQQAAQLKADIEQYGQGDTKAAEHLELLQKLGAPSYFLSDAAATIDSEGLNMAATHGALVKAYTSHYFATLNQQLRQGSMSQEQYKFARGLNEALDKLPPTGPTEVYRRVSGLDAAEASKYKQGYVVHQRGFTSTSTDPNKWSGDWKYVIKGYSGRDVSVLSEHPSESEVLFKHNTAFLVTAVHGKTIEMEEVD